MPQPIGFQPSIANYRFSQTIGGIQYNFRVLWNDRNGVWFFDALDQSDNPIYCGMALLLGSQPGRSCCDPLFQNGAFIVLDTTRQQLDAGFDDLGARVQVQYFTLAELIAEQLGT